MSIPEKDQKILWGKAAGRCSMPDCRNKVVLDASDEVQSKNILVGQNCHIVAEKENGPRGKSILTSEERNRYPNLILLCATHHIAIDQDPAVWPIERLHQVKADHEIWVENQLTDVPTDIGTQLYSDLVNTATDALMLVHWDWVSDHAVRLLLSEVFVDGVNIFWNKVKRTVWVGKSPELEAAISNMSERVGDYVNHFLSNAQLRENDDKPGEGFFVEDKSWKNQWRHDYDVYAQRAMKWQKQSTELLFNLALALNEYAEAVRKNLNPHYLVLEGSFVVTDSFGVLSEMRPAIYTPKQYIDVDFKSEALKKQG